MSQAVQAKPAGAEFGKWRGFFWPIHGHEIKKILPMLLMFFFISLNYSLLRNTKDGLVVTAGGAELISFLKLFFVVPGAILYMLYYSSLTNRLKRESLFYATIAPFLIFLVCFGFVIYPNLDTFVLSDNNILMQWRAGLHESLTNTRTFMLALKFWPQTIFYVMAELWGSVVLSLLFWAFANEITKVTEAKRFYGLFGLGANLALMALSPLNKAILGLEHYLGASGFVKIDAIQLIVYTTIISALVVMGIYRWINLNVLTDPRFYDPNEVKQPKKAKVKMKIGESIKFLVTSPTLLCLAGLVVCYGISINLIEVNWKNQLKQMFPDRNDYALYMNGYSFWLGVVTVSSMLFVSGNVIRHFGWRIAALVTPVTLVITGLGFFTILLCKDAEWLSQTLVALQMTPIGLAVFIGMIQNVISKAAKYSLFDPTKEMAYIPLDPELKSKGKAAVDVVGARVGKAGGAAVVIALLGSIPNATISSIAPYMATITFVILGLWMLSANRLSKELKDKV
ncbi:MAG: Npt1/Npt2 family nucleotide transporter [Gammaproteobacteria bacterium]